MIKVLFVCLGNICRSPMAEMVFKDMVNKKGLSNAFFIDSNSNLYSFSFPIFERLEFNLP